MNCGITGFSGALGQEYIKKNKKITFIKFHGDLTKKKIINSWVKNNKFDIFLHFAAVVPTNYVNKNYSYAKKVNIRGTQILINALEKFHSKKLKWFFFSSTSHVYNFSSKKIKENQKVFPISKYGKTKLLAEKLLLKKKLNICIGRIFSFTHTSHDEQYLIPSLYKKIYRSKYKYLQLENLNHNRDFLHLSDICSAISILMKKKKKGIYNICSARKTNLKKIAFLISRKKNKILEFNDPNFSLTNLVGDNNKMKKLGWRPKKNIKYIIDSFVRNKK